MEEEVVLVSCVRIIPIIEEEPLRARSRQQHARLVTGP